MKILFTGASSFTGYWFVNELVKNGHKVFAVFTRNSEEDYLGVKGQRSEMIANLTSHEFGVKFGDDRFLEIIQENSFDMLCHHAADVTNYKSMDFDFTTAFANNTNNLNNVLVALKENNCENVLLTQSVFATDEGAGSDDLRAVSPYGLSKHLTGATFDYFCDLHGLVLGKFVIPNPFGPYEETRFTEFMIKNWFAGNTPTVTTPLYIRDNIHVDLLARVYNKFAESLILSDYDISVNPSGYASEQGAFTEKFATEMRKRLGLECNFILNKQTEYTEPAMRVNTEPARILIPDWDEEKAWDNLAEYYKQKFAEQE